jgi:hypothetical protein
MSVSTSVYGCKQGSENKALPYAIDLLAATRTNTFAGSCQVFSCVCVYVRVRRLCVCACMRVCVGACMRSLVRVFVYVCMFVCSTSNMLPSVATVFMQLATAASELRNSSRMKTNSIIKQ